MKELKKIKLILNDSRATILLNRPSKHNALDPGMIEELHLAFNEVEQNDHIRFIVLAGEGISFCAGADIEWLSEAVRRERTENWQEYLSLAELLKKIARSLKITIAAAHRNALGGANGLLAACDFTIAEESTNFAFGEVKLGIVPAMILPFVARRVSTQNLKKLMFSGEPFRAGEAHLIGLIDFIAPDDSRMQLVDKLISELNLVSPNALKVCKQLILKVDSGELGIESSEYTAAILAELVHSEEGREGLQAFLEKRKPVWSQLKVSEN